MRRDVADAALGWVGTPYRHRASLRGAGADCLGLLRGVWRDVAGCEPWLLPAYSPEWRSGPEVLFEALSRHLMPLSAGQPETGDVLLFRMREGTAAKHLGVAVGEDRFVHAYSGRGVVSAYLTPPWARRVAARFAFPEGDA